MEEHRVRVEGALPQAARAVAAAAVAWGARWTPEGAGGGRLDLPITAGLRRGIWSGRVELSGTGEITWITLSPVEVRYHLNLPAVGVLVLGAAGALAATLWPFFPKLLAVAPLSVVLALAAWFLVVNRLRSGGVEEFLELVVAGPLEEGGEREPEPAPRSTRPR